MRHSIGRLPSVLRLPLVARFAAALLFAAGLLLFQLPWRPAGAEPVRPDWLAGALDEIRRAEYSFATEAGGTCTAPNRAHDLRARLSRDGIDLTSRTHGPDAWSLRLKLTAIGREGAAEATQAVWPQARANRVEYARGRTTEWYVNDERGLEQGFTLLAPPEGGRTSDSITIDLSFSGTLVPRVVSDGQAVMFSTPAGAPTLLYSGMSVVDGAGKALEATLLVAEGRIRLRFSDEGAIYPIVVDPMLTSPFFSTESNQSGAQLGISVATVGDVNGDGFSDIAIGANAYDSGQTDEGVVFVYKGGTSLTFLTTLQGDYVAAHFGEAVAAAGDVNGDGYGDMLVGAPNHHTALLDLAGFVYLFLGSASGPGVSAVWHAEGDSDLGHLGASVAWAGDVNADGKSDIIVGQPFYGDDVVRRGRALVWLGRADWSGVGTTPASADWSVVGPDGGALGTSVAAAGDVDADGDGDVLVGDSGYDGGQTDEGRAQVFLGSTSGLAATASWSVESDEAGAKFGSSVATAGDIDGDGYADILVGAPYATNGQSQEGRAYLYRGTSTGPTTSAAWRAESNLAGSRFGGAVSTAGDVNGDGFADVLIGASLFANGQTGEGKAFVWFGGNGGLGADGIPGNADWAPDETNQVQAQYGTSVATAGDVNGDGYSDVIVGAPLWESAGNQANEGKAFLYLGQPGGLSTAASSTSQGLQAGANYGTSVASAGDVNADGYGDLIVGAPNYDAGQTDEGKAFVFLGGPNGPPSLSSWSTESNQADGHLGQSVAGAGDVNGDGFSDVIIGAPGATFDQANEGRVFVFKGHNTGLSASADWSAEGDAAGTDFGKVVSTAGDVNGDGFADILVGSPLGSDTHAGEGRAFVWYGSDTGLGATGHPANADWTWSPDCVSAHFGSSVATAGDVNGDGLSDIIVGAPDHYNDCFNQQNPYGRAFVFHGSASGLSASPNWNAKSDQDNSSFGAAVAGVGDVNGDGYSDVLIGAPRFQNNSQTDEGHAFAWYGSSAGVNGGTAGRTGGPANYPWRAQADLANAKLGSAVAGAGDVNGDGYSDVLIGAPFYDNNTIDGGGVFIWTGSAGGVNNNVGGSAGTTPNYAWSAEGVQDNAEFGTSVAPAADVNGDGFTDVIIGARMYDNPNVNEGAAFVFLGNSGDGLERLARQGRFGDTSTIDILGKTYNTGDKFRVVARGRSAAGRDRVRLQWEVDPLLTAFAGTGMVTSTAHDTGIPVGGVGSAYGFSETHSGLTVGTTYRWRQRVLADSPFFPRSPWFTSPYNSLNETDLRAGTGTPVYDPQCGPCQIDFCTGADIGCHFTDTCGAGGCCQYQCGVFMPGCTVPECPPNVCGGC